MTFSKEFLIDSLEDNDATVATEFIGMSRWSTDWRRIFRHEGKLYATTYRRAATEAQDERPYEYDRPEIECLEVVAVEKTITVYEAKRP